MVRGIGDTFHDTFCFRLRSLGTERLRGRLEGRELRIQVLIFSAHFFNLLVVHRIRKDKGRILLAAHGIDKFFQSLHKLVVFVLLAIAYCRDTADCGHALSFAQKLLNDIRLAPDDAFFRFAADVHHQLQLAAREVALKGVLQHAAVIVPLFSDDGKLCLSAATLLLIEIAHGNAKIQLCAFFRAMDQHDKAAVFQRKNRGIHGGQLVLNILVFVVDDSLHTIQSNIASQLDLFERIAHFNAGCIAEGCDILFQDDVIRRMKGGIQIVHDPRIHCTYFICHSFHLSLFEYSCIFCII